MLLKKLPIDDVSLIVSNVESRQSNLLSGHASYCEMNSLFDLVDMLNMFEFSMVCLFVCN